MIRSGWLAILMAFTTLMAGFATPVAVLAQANVNSTSKYSAIVIDASSGEVLYSKRADSPRYPASITKVMTLYLVFEGLAHGRLRLDEEIPISKHAASQQPTKLGLSPGQTITVGDAIQALAIQSANDIAVAVAERIGGTESRFGALMTLRAQELGMTQSRFVNASGLPDSRQISSARDLAILSRAVMRDYPQYYGYLSQRQFYYSGRVMNNHNRLLMQMPGVDGLKTGFTSASGYNLAASAVRGDKRLIAVVLGGNSNAARDNQVKNLLETGFEVVRRRSSGENITIAQTQGLFEPAPSINTYARLDQVDETEQGDEGGFVRVSDTDDEDVAEGMRPIPNPLSTVRVSAAAASTPVMTLRPSQAAAAVKPKAKPAGRYEVQVGAFKDQSSAQQQLRDMTRRFTEHFRGADTDIGAKVGGYFRARFTGLSSDAASAACKSLKAKKVPCMVISP